MKQPDTGCEQQNGEQAVWDQSGPVDAVIQDCPVYRSNASAQCDDM